MEGIIEVQIKGVKPWLYYLFWAYIVERRLKVLLILLVGIGPLVWRWKRAGDTEML